MHLMTEPWGMRWVSWSRQPGQRRLVVDPAGQRRRDGDDHVRGLDLDSVGVDRDGLAVVDDPPDGRFEDDPVAELPRLR